MEQPKEVAERELQQIIDGFKKVRLMNKNLLVFTTIGCTLGVDILIRSLFKCDWFNAAFNAVFVVINFMIARECFRRAL